MPSVELSSSEYSGYRYLFYSLLGIILLVYLANAFTPLHLHVDSIRYYNIKDCIQYGCDPNSFAATDYLPYGYTALLVGLSKLGILNSVSIVLVNCFFLFTGIFMLQKVLKRYVSPGILVLLTLFNWTIIKFCAHPLSEMQYIFFSFSALYCFHIYCTRNSYLHLVAAFILCICTILTRTIGIALLPALILAIAWRHRDSIKDLMIRNKVAVVAIVLAGMAVVFFANEFKVFAYASNLKAPFQQGFVHFVTENFRFHFTELAEIFINVPLNKGVDYIEGSAILILFLIIGLLLFGWLMYALFMKRNQLPFYIKTYLLFYLLILMNWPYYDPRFWVPIIPLVIAVYLQTPFNLYTLLRIPARMHLVVYMILGISAGVYSLYAATDKHRFSSRHAKGVYRNEYETHFFGKPQSDTATHIDQNVLQILRKYD